MSELLRVIMTEVTTVRLQCPYCGDGFWDSYTKSYYVGEDAYKELSNNGNFPKQDGRRFFCTNCGKESLPLARSPYRKYPERDAHVLELIKEFNP